MSIRKSGHRMAGLAGLVGLAALAGLALRQSASPGRVPREPEVTSALQAAKRLPLHFEPTGATRPGDPEFAARGDGYLLELAGNRTTMRLRSGDGGQRTSTSLSVDLLGASRSRGNAEAPRAGTSNYFLGADSARWRTGVRHFDRVRFREVYSGIDVVYYGRQDQLEYDFVVSPGADPEAIRLGYSGARSLEIAKDGSLLVSVDGGAVTQHAPVVYQDLPAGRVAVEGAYTMLAPDQVAFRVGPYDRSETLVIDPVINYSSYLGGGDREEAGDAAVDGDGNLYVTGATFSANYPTQGAASVRGGSFDAFVTKINPDGGGIVYSTYFGGTGDENVDGSGNVFGALALDANRQAYVAGFTTSTDMPVVQPIQVRNSGNGDAFVFALNGAGSAIRWSTYLGGRDRDAANGLAVDSNGSLTIVGETSSQDFNVVNAFQASFAGGARDAFLTRLNAQGTGMVYSTYLGGSGDDFGRGAALDALGNVAITGQTVSTNFPITAGSFQPTNQGSSDAFVTKFNPVAAQLVYSSYLGGSGENRGTGIAMDIDGNAYVTGYTTSTDFPTTTGAFDETWNGGISDGFVVKVNASGSTKVYSSYLGGAGEDIANRVAISQNANGNTAYLAYVTGVTNSPNFPVYAAIRTSPVGGFDAFVTKLTVDGSAVEYSTYYGGSSDDRGTGIAVDDLGRAYVVGTTLSADFPIVLPFDATLAGTSDNFFARLIGPPGAPGPLLGVALDSRTIELDWDDNSDNETGFVVERRVVAPVPTAFGSITTPSLPANSMNLTDSGLQPNTTYAYRVRAENGNGDSAFSNSVEVMTPPDPPVAPDPIGVTAVSQSALRVDWTDTNTTEMEYRIEESADGVTFAEVGIVPAAAGSGSTVSFSHIGLATFSLHYYRVRGVNAGGNGAYSLIVVGRTMDNPPAAPTSLTATTISNTEILLSWLSNSINETDFRIERSTDGITFTTAGMVGAGVTSFLDTGLLADTFYSYRVAALNSGGDSGFSNIATATTYPDPPADPSSLNLTVLGQTGMELEWQDNSTTEDGFRIERSDDGGFTFVPIATLGSVAGTGSVVNYVDGGLTANTTYHYVVYAFNLGGDSGPTTIEQATTLPNPPAAPSLLRAVVQSQTQIQLLWSDNSNDETGFVLERSTDGANFAVAAVLAADVRQYTDTGLTAATLYFYRLRAVNAGGSSAYSGTVNVATLPNPPLGPTDLQGTLVNAAEAFLSWLDNADNEVNYLLERSEDNGVTYTEIAVRPAVPGTGQRGEYSDTSIQPDKTYLYRLRARNAGGLSIYSNRVTINTPPATPGSLNATVVDASTIRISWLDLSSTETGFEIQRRLGGATVWAVIATTAANITSYQDTGLAGATTYEYQVIAVSSAGRSLPSNTAAGTTLPSPPTAPSGLTAVVISQTQIDLAWNDNSGNETQFRIYRRIAGGLVFAQVAVVAANTVTYQDQNLQVGTTYEYQVRSSNNGGDSVPSNTATATTFPAAPSGPTSLTATPQAADRVVLNWQDNAVNEAGFRIERADNGVTFVQIAQITAQNVNTYTDSGLNANTTYSYRVRTFNQGGNSGFSNTAAALTMPAAPTNLQAAPVGSGSIRLNWNHSRGGDGFEIQAQSAGSGFGQVGIVGAGITTFTHSGLLPNRTFQYRVIAFNRSGNSLPSNAAAATTQVGVLAVQVRPVVFRGGARPRGVVQLNGPAPAEGLVVDIVSDSDRVVILDRQIVIPAGATAGNFRTRALKVRVNTSVRITATAGGAGVSTTVTVRR